MTDERVNIARLTAEKFNARHPVGTAVIAYPGVRGQEPVLNTRTRTPAWALGHRARSRILAGSGHGEPVVSVEGYTGGIALSHIDVATA